MIFAMMLITYTHILFTLFLLYESDAANSVTRFENIDVDKILHSDRLISNYVNCFLDKGPCAPVASDIKRLIPDALQSECQNCTEAERKRGIKVYNYLIENKPEIWKELEAKYDPKGIYLKKLHEEAKKDKASD